MRYLILFLLFFTTSLHAKATVCLNMIVKDESAVIRRCLDSVMPLIDYWVIVDTGSTDGTQEIIKEHLKDIPGELYEEPWVDFGHNRTQALQHARGKADYLLIMDADDWLDYEEGYTFPELTYDAYSFTRGSVGFTYHTIQLVKNTLPWRWIGPLHEYLQSDYPHSLAKLEGIRYIQTVEGSRSQDPDKYWKHVAILHRALLEEPDNSRHLFYLAESYRDAGAFEEAVRAYEKRVALGGWEEEVYWSLLQIGKLKKQLGEDSESIINAFYRAHRARPSRPEAIYYLAEHYIHIGRHDLAYAAIHSRPFIPPREDILFKEQWMEDWGLDFQLSISAYYLGHYQESLDLCDRVMEAPNLPYSTRLQAQRNRYYPLKQEAFKKKILIAILARNKAHVLPTYLDSIEKLDYDKNLISLYIHTNNNEDETEQILDQWLAKTGHLYHEVFYVKEEVQDLKPTNPHEWNAERWNVLGQIRNRSLRKTLECGCDYYFVVDCDTFLIPETLKELLIKNKPIVAPLVTTLTNENPHYANFFAAVTPEGYYQDSDQYLPILKREKVGTFKVPLVHITYLIKADVIDQLSYIDGGNEWEFIVFARSAREHGIDQYICNERDFGGLIHFSDKVTLEKEKAFFTQLDQDALKPDLLAGRISPKDKRHKTMKRALELLEKRGAKVLVETGTSRYGTENFESDGGSTVIFSNWARLHDAFLYSVDLDPHAVFAAECATLPYRESLELVTSDSVPFLENFPQQIDFLYLDSLDFDFNNPAPSQQHHLREIQAAYDKLSPDCVIMIDDCKLPHGGKGKEVLSFLKERGWTILEDAYQVILTRESTIPIENNFAQLLESAKKQERNDTPENTVVNTYRQACYSAGYHIEPFFYLSRYYRGQKKYEEAYRTAREGATLLAAEKEVASNEKWLYDFGMLWELSLCAHSVGKFDEAIELSEKLLESPVLSSQQKWQLGKNISYYKAGVEVEQFCRKKWGTSLGRLEPKLHVLAVATDEKPELGQLRRSCEDHGIKLHVLGMGQPFTFGAKLRWVREYLDEIPSHDIILLLDAYDTLVLADSASIIEKFQAYNTPFIVSTEVNCHPFPHHDDHYPDSPTRFKYINTGSYIGYAGYVKYLLDELDPIADETDDQGLISALYLYQPFMMQLDYTADLFLTLNQVELNQIAFENRGVRSLETQTLPCVIHGNGPGKWLYQYIYEQLYGD